jgi:(4S)-4-hydroxy-5-phosphonooxypentane-2,3-dione isomerase
MMTNQGKRAIYTILFFVTARPGQRQQLVDFLTWDQKESMEHERGTLSFDIFEDQKDKDTFYVYEAYEDEAAFEEHKKGEAYKRWSSDEFQNEVIFPHVVLERVKP